MITRTVIAHCDAVEVFESGSKDCFESVSLDPDSTQVFNDLRRLGWKLYDREDGIKTVCPKHEGEPG